MPCNRAGCCGVKFPLKQPISAPKKAICASKIDIFVWRHPILLMAMFSPILFQPITLYGRACAESADGGSVAYGVPAASEMDKTLADTPRMPCSFPDR